MGGRARADDVLWREGPAVGDDRSAWFKPGHVSAWTPSPPPEGVAFAAKEELFDAGVVTSMVRRWSSAIDVNRRHAGRLRRSHRIRRSESRATRERNTTRIVGVARGVTR